MSDFKLNWKGDEVAKAVASNVAQAMSEFALEVEAAAKKELKKSPNVKVNGKIKWLQGQGQGVRTGTLRRSIHTALPGYNWGADNVEPSASSPERGRQSFDAMVNGRKITIQVGSGLVYAMAVHQGHDSFDGHHYLTKGFEKAKPKLKAILEKYKVK